MPVSDESDTAALTKSPEESRELELRRKLNQELHPRRSALHRFFVLVSVLTIGTAACMAFGQFLGMAFKSIGIIQYVLRVYVIGLCALVILNELELFSLTTDSKILWWWIPRGALYTFIGVLGLEENNTIPADRNDNAVGRDMALVYIKVVAWMMFSCGLLYFVMGAFCLQLVNDRMREEHKRRVERSREIRRTTETYGTAGNIV